MMYIPAPRAKIILITLALALLWTNKVCYGEEKSCEHFYSCKGNDLVPKTLTIDVKCAILFQCKNGALVKRNIVDIKAKINSSDATSATALFKNWLQIGSKEGIVKDTVRAETDLGQSPLTLIKIEVKGDAIFVERVKNELCGRIENGHDDAKDAPINEETNQFSQITTTSLPTTSESSISEASTVAMSIDDLDSETNSNSTYMIDWCYRRFHCYDGHFCYKNIKGNYKRIVEKCQEIIGCSKACQQNICDATKLPLPLVFEKFGDSEYSIPTCQGTYSQAVQVCEKHGAKLPKLNSQEAQHVYTEMLSRTNASVRSIWLDLNGVIQPEIRTGDGSCVSVNNSGIVKYHYDCYRRLPFSCIRKSENNEQTTLETDTATTSKKEPSILNDTNANTRNDNSVESLNKPISQNENESLSENEKFIADNSNLFNSPSENNTSPEIVESGSRKPSTWELLRRR